MDNIKTATDVRAYLTEQTIVNDRFSSIFHCLANIDGETKILRFEYQRDLARRYECFLALICEVRGERMTEDEFEKYVATVYSNDWDNAEELEKLFENERCVYIDGVYYELDEQEVVLYPEDRNIDIVQELTYNEAVQYLVKSN